MTEIPTAGHERLLESRTGVFTSDLSVNEYSLVHDAGFAPVGLVLGTSIYHIGMQRRQIGASHELDVLSQALYHARELAMQRLQAEAVELEADGVVGVRLEVKGFGSGGHVAEFLAVGTAVRHRDGDAGYRTADDRPFTSDLSGQDFWTLLKTGSRPLGLVMGSCVYSIGAMARNRPRMIWKNAELVDFTQAMYDARELAMTRMQREADDLGATGIVGVDLSENAHGWGGRLVEFFSVGTAIARTGDPTLPAPAPMLDLGG